MTKSALGLGYCRTMSVDCPASGLATTFKAESRKGENRRGQSSLAKTLLAMKLTMVLLTAAFVNVYATSSGQSVTLSGKNLTLKQVFTAIKKQTGYVVFANESYLSETKKISVSVYQVPLKELLDIVFEGQPLTYAIKGETIVLSRKVPVPSLFDTPVIIVHPITGKVTDEAGHPVAGASVMIKGAASGTTTDADGNFSVHAERGQKLVISSVAFESKEITIGQQTVLQIELTRNISGLGEVVFNAGYYNVKASERTGSIARVSGKEIERQPVNNVMAAMQGRMAGVHIAQTTGTPGGGFQIQIRGINSLRSDGNAPLFIIDGVPYSSETIGNNQTNRIHPTVTSPLNNLNPGDIESIEVLKDADATAIYGSRGANGVVLVTTKKAKQGKSNFTANVSRGAGKVTRFMQLMNTEQYLAMRAEAFEKDGITEYPETDYDINGTWDPQRYTNWQKALLGGSAQITNIQSSLSGGSEKTQYLIGGNFNQETTVIPGNFVYRKGNLRVNINHTSSDKKFNLNFSAGYTLQNNDQPATDLTVAAMITPPNAPALYQENGDLNWENNTFANPLANLNGKSRSKTNDLVASTILSYQLPYGFELRSTFGFTALQHQESATSPSTTFNPAFNFGAEYSSAFVSDTKRQSWIVEPQLNWKKDIGKAHVELLAGTTFQQQLNDQLVQTGTGFPSNNLIYNMSAATTVRVNIDEETIYKYQAVFGRANLNWDRRYILNLTARRDGSSRFGPGRQFANFAAAGAAWLFSNESWLSQQHLLSFGKLRASYGTTGNDQIGNYQFLNTYGSAGVAYQGVVALMPLRLYNPDFGWEENRKLEIAMETGWLKDRIFVTGSWYRNRSSSQLVGIPLPGTAGFPSLQANMDATVENTGVEFTLRTINVQKGLFSWITNINFSRAKNRLLSFPGLESSTFANQYVVGKPLNIRKLYQYTGLDKQAGLYTFADVNNDGILSSPTDRQTVKDLNPVFFGGFQNQLRWGAWELDFLFQFVKQENFNVIAFFSRAGTMINQPLAATEHWSQPGDDAPYQVYTSGANNATVATFSRYIQSDASISDASYIRLKNISLLYEVPRHWIGNIGCRLSLQAQNLFTITSYRGADPEFSTMGYLPPLRVFTAGVMLTL